MNKKQEKHPVKAIAFIILLTIAGELSVGAEESLQSDINVKVAKLNIDTATLNDVIKVFGKPEKYLWGQETFAKNNLPSMYLAAYYSNRVQFFIRHGKVSEIRFEGPGTGYAYRGKLKIGSSLDEVFEVVGRPRKTITGQANRWEDGVLYKDIDGRKGFCYYKRADQNVRFFFGDYKVANIYLIGSDSGRGDGSFRTVRPVKLVKKFDDVRWKDMSRLVLSGKRGLVRTLTFNLKTVWPVPAKMPAGSDPNKILTAAMNPGLGVRELHKEGITGKGVNVGIIDQPMYLDHPEFAGKIAAYHDVGCGTQSSMHGPAVASLLVGTNCGTAPDARVYYVAAPSWKKDAAYYAKALDWIIEQNEKLPALEKIRVVSVSAAPSGPGSPFEKNNKMWDSACKRAEAAGIGVLDCTRHHGFIGACWYNARTPESVIRCRGGFPGRSGFRPRAGTILVPSSPRTTAEEYEKGQFAYQYCGRGGLSWAIPYCAGVFALGWQVNPELSFEQMRDLLFESAHTRKTGEKFINPKKFIGLVKKTKAVPKP